MHNTRWHKYTFMGLMVLFSVTAFIIYNLTLSFGTINSQVLAIALGEIPLMFTIALAIEALFVNKLALKIAFKLVNPQQSNPFAVILAITGATIIFMCPLMSMAATIIYDGFTPMFISNWLQKISYNLPFAVTIQLLFVGPVVRFIFKQITRLVPVNN